MLREYSASEYSVSDCSTSVEITALPLYSADEILASCTGAVVVAPHPDDETLGCGGAIALLRQLRIPVQVLVMSDGTQSHPQSKAYPAKRLKKLRESEALNALKMLGVAAVDVTFYGWSDTAIPHPSHPNFEQAVTRCNQQLLRFSPSLLFVPWQGDQHCDHQATWKIIQRCVRNWPQPPLLLAYSIWGSRAAGLRALPQQTTGWRLDIRSVQDLKRQAALAHQSQTTDLINDDPDGFRLTPTMLNNLIQPWETYLEVS